MLIGQSEVCDLVLPDRRVSRRHLALELAGDSLRVNDLGSTNGTFVAGIRVIDVLLRGGEDVRHRDTTLRVARVDREARGERRVRRARASVGSSARAPRCARLYPLCERLARTDVPVLIEGETGTGKEVLAEAMHEAGPRASGPFVVFDCTAVPPSLVESELFGHERGAFTGAVAARTGLFEQAHGGTLLIDEIGDLEPGAAAQAPARDRAGRGAARRRRTAARVDVRILAATRRDLDREVQRGRFRDDLFHRLAVARIELPPLRHRRGTSRSSPATSGVSSAAARRAPGDLSSRWEDYGWPGNVRELHNAVARLSPSATSRPSAPAPGDAPILPPSSAFEGPFGPAHRPWREQLNDEFERVYIEHVLAVHGGDIGEGCGRVGDRAPAVLPTQGEGRALMRGRAWTAIAVVCFAFVGGSSRANADEKGMCSEKYQDAQRMRASGKLLLARADLLRCAEQACPPFVSNDCKTWLAQVETDIPTLVFAVLDPDGHDVPSAGHPR